MSQESEKIELAGGAEKHEGFEVVGTVCTDDPEQTQTFSYDDLKPVVQIHQMNGVSIALNQVVQNSNVGTIVLRIIHDTKMRAYLHRKDEDKMTIFKVSAGMNVS